MFSKLQWFANKQSDVTYANIYMLQQANCYVSDRTKWWCQNITDITIKYLCTWVQRLLWFVSSTNKFCYTTLSFLMLLLQLHIKCILLIIKKKAWLNINMFHMELNGDKHRDCCGLQRWHRRPTNPLQHRLSLIITAAVL